MAFIKWHYKEIIIVIIFFVVLGFLIASL